MLKQIFEGRPNTGNITVTYPNGYYCYPLYLIKCLTSGRIAPFPKIEQKQVARCKPSNHTLEIICSCRTQWTAQRNSSYDMAQC